MRCCLGAGGLRSRGGSVRDGRDFSSSIALDLVRPERLWALVCPEATGKTRKSWRAQPKPQLLIGSSQRNFVGPCESHPKVLCWSVKEWSQGRSIRIRRQRGTLSRKPAVQAWTRFDQAWLPRRKHLQCSSRETGLLKWTSEGWRECRAGNC